MKSDITKILNILDSNAKFLSKGFSNGYNFDEKKAGDYLNDILSNTGESPIFSGIIILQHDNINYSVVDGLQRLTTINLLIAAICSEYSIINLDAAERIKMKYLLKDNRPKLVLQGNDKKVYDKIIMDVTLDYNDKNSNVFKAYNNFLDILSQNKNNATKCLKILTQVQYLFVITKETEISTRELYQSLNSTKQDSQINLISDYISHQDVPSKNIWKKITTLFDEHKNKFENFIKDFLQSRFADGITNPNSVYLNFKKYYEKMLQYQSSKSILETLNKYAVFYIRILNEDFRDEEIKNQISMLNQNSGAETYPYLMEVLDDLESGHITDKAFLNILIMMNIFISNSNKENINGVEIDFARLSKELNKMMILKDYVPEIISENKVTINEINNLSNFEV